MGVGQGRSRFADLSFQVFSRPLHPDWFRVCQYRRITMEGWEADIRLIHGGHVVIFRTGPVCLTEVLAGTETEVPDTARLFQSRIRHERTASLNPGPGVAYQTAFEVERVDLEVFAHLSEEMSLDASGFRLFHQSTPVTRFAPAPISHLRFSSRANGLTIHAFHTFPDDRAIVRTQSLFERVR